MEEATGGNVPEEPAVTPKLSKSKSNRSLRSSVTQAFEDVDEADFAGGGLGQLHDLAIRSQFKSKNVLSVVQWVRRQCRLLSDTKRVHMVIQMLYREQLLSMVRGAIVKESKARKILPKVGFENFLKQARFILQVGHERSCIATMVSNWAMMQRMINFKETSDCSRVNERMEKVSSFWSERVSNSPKRSDREDLRSRESSRPATADAGFQPPFLPSRSRRDRLSSASTLRRRVLKDRVSALMMDTTSEQLSEQKPLPVQYKRSPGWAKEIERPVTAASSMAKSQSLTQLQPLEPSWRAEASLRWTRTQESKNFYRSASSKFFSATRLHQDWQEPPDVALPGKPPSLEDRYVNICRTQRAVPVPLSFVEGQSTKLDGRDMLEAQMLALVNILEGRVEEVNMENNRLVTDQSLAPLFQKLHAPHMRESLHTINLRHCRAGLNTLEMCVELLSVAMNLRHVDMSGLQLAVKLQLPLCMGLGSHQSLETVALAGVGLGGTTYTAECARRLVGSVSFTSLDLSWNSFDGEDFQQMGKQLMQTKPGGSKLKKLYLDSTSTTVGNFDCSISELLEALAYNTSLTFLSIAANRLDFKPALILEDALENHRCMRSINISQNPLGILGLRSMLRLMARKENEIRHFDAEGCFTGGPDVEDDVEEDKETTCQTFSFTNPGGRYRLHLARPYHRAMLRMLCKTAERYKVGWEKSMSNVSYSLPERVAVSKNSSTKIWQVPTAGELSFTFSLESQIEAKWSSLDEDDFVSFLQHHFEFTRFKPSLNKVVPLCSKWAELNGRSLDQEVFIQALAKDFNMSVAYVQHLCKAAPSVESDVINAMLPCTAEDGGSRYLLLQTLQSLPALVTTFSTMECFLLFNVSNPTGHYKLELNNTSEFAVAQRLLLLDRWESVINKRRGRIDISSRGNSSHFRNELHAGQPLRSGSVAEWTLPEADEFELDYVSSKRPSTTAKSLTDPLWERLMVNLHKSQCDDEERLKVLRSISHEIYITAKHMRQMMGFFKDSDHRQEAFVMFYTRIIDVQNMKLCYVRFGKEEELARLQHRLGQAYFFPFFQPENAKFELDLSHNDHQIVAKMLVSLAAREKPSNLRDASWQKEDGTLDDFAMGIPRSWENAAPDQGIFRCRYVCSADDRNVKWRKELAQKYSYFPRDVTDSDVNWLTGLNEPPQDVLDLLEFFLSRVKSMDEAFNIIDGGEPGCTSNSELTLREFERGLSSMECQKFAGPDEQARIAAVFRYLDPGGEGTVSLKEWSVLDQLWQEFDLTVKEFVQFLTFAFGENLEDSWKALDEDGSGELTEEEFNEAVQLAGYFGPARVVFALLDGSDDGNISWQEFNVLDKYKKK